MFNERIGIPGFFVYQPAHTVVDIRIIHPFKERVHFMMNVSGDFANRQPLFTCLQQDVENLLFVVHRKQNTGSRKT